MRLCGGATAMTEGVSSGSVAWQVLGSPLSLERPQGDSTGRG
jgi:hypothetical protein